MGVGKVVSFLAGGFVAIASLLVPAEIFLRCFPPRDIEPFLQETSSLTGPWNPHQAFGATYASTEEFQSEYRQRWSQVLQARSSSTPVWALFGNSFIQMKGMLADTLRDSVPDRVIFHLGRNELLNVRLAQIEILLQDGLRPERFVIALMPVDLIALGEQPLDTIQVTRNGGYAYRPRLPTGVGGSLLDSSRLALTAWLRTGLHVGNPSFDRHRLYEGVHPILANDVRSMFAYLAEALHRASTPATILLIPAYHQIAAGAPFQFQDDLAPIFAELGYDVLDPRAAFRVDDPESLFLPDRHFNDKGNAILARELLAHIGYSVPPRLAGQGEPRQ